MPPDSSSSDENSRVPTPAKPRKARRKQRYELCEQVGAGGSGAVYRALDRELNRTVAIKVLLPELAVGLKGLLFLKREIVLASKISDPHVVRVYDFGEANGKPVLVMEWIDGESLGSLLRRVHRLPPSQACDLATQICQGLSAIHKFGIVHRDLKPGNLLVRQNGELLVGDFGLARTSSDVSLSDPGDTSGTPRYMAPEQLAGLPADPRSDLYSFGLVVLEMLTGTTTLDSLDGLRQSLMDSSLERQIRSGEMRKLAALHLVVRRCLRLDRNERYATADEVLRDLRAADIGRPEAAIPPPSLLPARPAHKKRWLRWTAMLAIAPVLVAFLIWGEHFVGQKSIANQAAADRLYAKAATLLSRQSGEEGLRTGLQNLDEALAIRPNYGPAAAARLETLIRLYESTSEGTWLDQARQALKIYAALRPPEPGLTLFQARIDLNAGLFANVLHNLQSDPRLLSSSSDANRLLARALEGTDQLQRAVQYYETAIRMDPESWISYNDLGNILLKLGDLERSRQQFVRVIQLKPGSDAGYGNLGIAFLYKGDLENARLNFEKALEILASAETYYNLGLTASYNRRYAVAVPFFQAAINLRPASERYALALGDALRHAGRLDLAQDQYGKVLSLLAARAEKRPLSIEELCRKARAFANLNDLTSAKSVLDSASQLNAQDQGVLYTKALIAVIAGQNASAKKQMQAAIRAGYPAALARMDPDLSHLF